MLREEKELVKMPAAGGGRPRELVSLYCQRCGHKSVMGVLDATQDQWLAI
jgi:hypothetical protein